MARYRRQAVPSKKAPYPKKKGRVGVIYVDE